MTQSAGQLSRRSLLRRILDAVGAAAILSARPNAVAYQDHPEGDKRCEKCAQFQPPNECKMVDGSINPQGYCRIFAPIRQS